MGPASIAHANCAQGAVICKLTDKKKLPSNAGAPPHIEFFGCQAGGLFHMGSCHPMPDQLANAQKICKEQYGGVADQTQCSVDWGSVVHQIGEYAETMIQGIEGSDVLSSAVEKAAAAIAANPELLSVALI